MKTVLCALIVVALTACGGSTPTEPGAPTTPETTATTGGETPTDAGTAGATTGSMDAAAWQTAVAAGAERFDRACTMCHGEGGVGDGAPDLRNIHFTADRMRTQIRNGSGQMRPISETRLPNADMENVLAWLTTIGAVDMPHP